MFIQAIAYPPRRAPHEILQLYWIRSGQIRSSHPISSYHGSVCFSLVQFSIGWHSVA